MQENAHRGLEPSDVVEIAGEATGLSERIEIPESELRPSRDIRPSLDCPEPFDSRLRIDRKVT